MHRLFAGAGALALAAAPCAARAVEATDAEATSVDELIVTGTRLTGLHAGDSPAPIQVVDEAGLQRSGAQDAIGALALTVPSFQAQAIGGDMANETLAARLRGLSPNHTLVLINGKRRHGTANLAILTSAFQGGAAADLNLIPLAGVERIEVLQDGAAAQYGSDAIAGVVNIILKSDDHGGVGSVSGGGYFEGDGDTAALDLNLGFKPAEGAWLNLTAETRWHDFSNPGGPDQRVEQAIDSGAHPEWADLPGYPYLNRIFGDARYRLNLAGFNAGWDLPGGTTFYAFGTYGRKYAAGWANFRLPIKLPALYPLGFSPLDVLREDDYALTAGVRRQAGGWDWDLGSTYGEDDAAVHVERSANVDLYNDTGSTPTDFYAGGFAASQWTTTLDLRREFEIGLASPLTLALGAEHRRETYEIRAGDEASRYKAGSQSFPGFALSDAGDYDRHNEAVYVDLAVSPVERLTLDLAARHERFSDFGDTTVGKLTGRFDVSDAFAVRGTASTGFRAPTLAESYYSATNVQPNSAFVQLPPNAPAAALIGIEPLGPEASVNLSLGFVARPFAGAVLTLDAYQIDVDDRVVGSGTLYGTYGGVVRSSAVNDAIVANDNTLESVPFTGVKVFSNGLDTRTRGADVVLTFTSRFDDGASVDWTVAANYNETEVTAVRPTPAEIAASGQSLFDRVAISTLETASPKYKATLAALYRKGGWTVRLRETFYGQSSAWSDPGDGTYYLDKAGAKLITDLEVSYALPGETTLSVGANNLFDVRPDRVNPDGLAASAQAGNPAVEIYPAFSPYGINGGYGYVRLRKRF